MRKWGWRIAVGIAAILCGLAVYWKAKTCESAANQCYASAIEPSRLPVGYQSASKYEAIQTCRETQSYLCRVIAPANIPSVFLIIIGAFGIIAAFASLEIIERQTQAIQKQADAMVNAERAWVVAEMYPIARHYRNYGWCRIVDSKPVAMSAGEILAGEHLKHGVRLTNMGRTPAFIIHHAVHCYTKSESGTVELFGFPYRSLGAGNSIDMDQVVRVSVYAKDAPSYFEVVVKYRHVFSRTYVTSEPCVYALTPGGEHLVRVEGIPDKPEETEQTERY